MKNLHLKSAVGMIGILLIFVSSGVFGMAQGVSSPKKKQSIEERAKEMVSHMTQEEKIGLIVGDGRFLPASDSKAEKGQGMIIKDQRSKLLIPRLGIRSTAMSDGPAGLNREARKEGQKNYH